MLAALLVAVVAALFAGVAVAAALGTLDVTASDCAHTRARAAAETGVELGLHRLCWLLLRPDATLGCEIQGANGAVGGEDAGGATADLTAVTLETVEAVGLGWPLATRLVRVTGEASCGRASARTVSLVTLQPTAMPRGISVTEDADVQAAIGASGCGLYVGGVVRGRENVSFSAPVGEEATGDSAPDHAWGGRWPVAGVHAGGGIWAAGVEIRDLDPLPPAYANDTVAVGVQDLVKLPDAAWLASARAHALDPADAFAGGVLHLDRLPPALPTGEPGSAEVAGVADPAAGFLVCVSSKDVDGGVIVVGRRDPAWAPVTVVVEGDARLGDPSSPPLDVDDSGPTVSFRGALVATGYLEVAATSSITGHLACRRLLVAAPLAVTLDAGWRERPLIGSLEPFLLARE